MQCKHCNNYLQEGENGNAIVLCRYKEGFVHKNCCENECNQGGYCEHKIAEYSRVLP